MSFGAFAWLAFGGGGFSRRGVGVGGLCFGAFARLAFGLLGIGERVEDGGVVACSGINIKDAGAGTFK